MSCRIVDMRQKQIICIKNGTFIGFLCDVEVDSCCGKVIAIVVFGHRTFPFFGHRDDFVIPWEQIAVIGKDSILVNCEPPCGKRKPWLFNRK